MSSCVLAEYQNLVYGNDQLLLKRANSFDIIGNKNRASSKPFFVECMDTKDISTVHGYIRLKCQTLLPLNQNIPMDIIYIMLYYYCFTEEQYDGSIEEWTKEELRTRYIPLKPIAFHSSASIFEGKSTHFDYNKDLAFGDTIVLKKINYMNAIDTNQTTETDASLLPLLREMRILRDLFGCRWIIELYDVLLSIDSVHATNEDPLDLNDFFMLHKAAQSPHTADVAAVSGQQTYAILSEETLSLYDQYLNSKKANLSGPHLTMIYGYMDADLGRIFCTAQYFTPLHVQYMLYNILLGVRYIHDAHIVHRTLRPSCILINGDCSIKITDFHAACGINEEQERQKCHVQHRWYRAPETILLHASKCTNDDLYLMDIWSVGCIFAELLQMNQANCPNARERCPLFPGDSCFPLSPNTIITDDEIAWNSRKDQLYTICSVIGTPTNEDIEWLIDQNARSYMQDVMKEQIETNDDALNFITAEGGVDLLKNMLKFDLKTRFSAASALKSEYFDTVRDAELENMSPPNVYSYPEIQEYSYTDRLSKECFDKLLSEELSNYT